jgi:putative FmdB family regulatory protein
MPTYEYECSDCNHEFEAFQSITADPLTECPACKKNAAKRRISGGGGLIFKGSGFYCTDYKSTGYKQDESVDRHKKAAKEVKESQKGADTSSSSGSSTASSSTPAASS